MSRKAPRTVLAALWLAVCLPLAVHAESGQQANTAAESPELLRQMQALFADGFSIGPKGLKAAHQHWQAARRTAPNDRRADMAYGFVLLRQSQYKPAIAQFEAVRGQPGDMQFDAWQAQIWAELVDRQYDAGLAHLAEYAGVVRQVDRGAQASLRQVAAADWIGQTFEALDTTASTASLHEAIAEQVEAVREALGDELYIAFELGRDAMRERDLVLAHEATQARQTGQKKEERRRQQELERIANDLQNLQKEKQSAGRSAEDWKKWLDEALAKADKALGECERDYQQLEKRRQSLDQAITLLGREMTGIQSLSTFAAANPLAAQNAQFQAMQRYSVLQTQMFNYQVAYNAAIGQMTQMAQQAQSLMNERAAVIARYEKATGQLVKKDADIDKWTARLNDKKQQLDVKAPDPAATKTAAGPRKPGATFKSYLPLDLDARRAALLATFGIENEAPQDADK